MSNRNRVPLTEDMILRLKTLKDETGCGAKPLYTHILNAKLIPQGGQLSAKKIESWHSGLCKTVRIDEYEAVIKAYETLPKSIKHKSADTRIGSRIQVTEDFLRKLSILTSRTADISFMLKRANAPQGITHRLIAKLKNREVDTILQRHMVFFERMFEHYDIS